MLHIINQQELYSNIIYSQYQSKPYIFIAFTYGLVKPINNVIMCVLMSYDRF